MELKSHAGTVLPVEPHSQSGRWVVAEVRHMSEKQERRTWQYKHAGVDVLRGGQASLSLDEDQDSMSLSKQGEHHTGREPSMALAKPERDQSKDHEEGAMLTGRLAGQMMAMQMKKSCRWRM